jgi:hypothetical protein
LPRQSSLNFGPAVSLAPAGFFSSEEAPVRIAYAGDADRYGVRSPDAELSGMSPLPAMALRHVTRTAGCGTSFMTVVPRIAGSHGAEAPFWRRSAIG